MIRLTKGKARELVKRELGINVADLTDTSDSKQHPWFEMHRGNMDIVVRTEHNGLVTSMHLTWNGHMDAYFFTDTLDPFIEADYLWESEVKDEEWNVGGESVATSQYRDDMTYMLNRHYHIPQISRRCKECGCIDTADKQVDWLYRNLCRNCGIEKIEEV